MTDKPALFKFPAQVALLQALLAGPDYGLNLIKRVEKASGGSVILAQGAVYPALLELQNTGAVRSWDIPRAAGGGRPRRYFELTPAGRAQAEAMRQGLLGLLSMTTQKAE